ncbi:DNA topoisomerase III [Niallia taxi]|uniref:DNA topoisomerase n=1 Tax=Niallia taxi TaxID=2499688 RepID=A0A437K6P4_9BACI|nr:DNA topoisomerase III [Niallia taxi]RVT59077.1 DNA topoisomerase III [Niallia taxi]
MKSLVLCEKPSVAREIARVLGCNKTSKSYIESDKYIVTWALGHLIELKMPEHYDPKYKNWNLDDLPIIPEKMDLKVMKQTSHQYKAIEQLAKRKDVHECIIATDAGREGELVARWILDKIRFQKPMKRLWISSQTDKAILDGFRKLKSSKEFDPLYASAVCRAQADWLIGLNVTRALTTKFNDPLSAGRVQTPTLSLVIEREKQIQSFVPKEYWTISAKIGESIAHFEKNGEKRIFSKEQVEAIINSTKNERAKVTSMTRKEKTEHHPLPYDLTELQRDANKIFGFSAKKTLNVMQKLYEQHKLVTYPRTDSRYLTTDMKDTMFDRLQSVSAAYKEEAQKLLVKKGKMEAANIFNNDKVSDHHAIIPTEQPVFLHKLDNDEKKIYDLIVKRFLALFYPKHKYEVIATTLTIGGHSFIIHDTNVIEPGFKALTGTKAASNTLLSSLKQGQEVGVSSVKSEQKWTEPPLRYSEADILGKMEKFGLGTPATRAEIIERLVTTEVVERQNGRFYSTQKGKQLLELVNDDLTSPELTATWEQKLEDIAKGKANPDKFMLEIKQQTKQFILEIKNSDKAYKVQNLTGSKCPECGSFLKEKNTKNGKVLVCSSMDCNFSKRKDPKLSNKRCPQCHKKMEIHDGKAGTYFQCRSCNVVEKAADRKKTVSKKEERKLVQKYTKDEGFGNSLGDLLKAAMNKEDDK